MTMKDQIREHMPILCADGQSHGEVDHLDGPVANHLPDLR